MKNLTITFFAILFAVGQSAAQGYDWENIRPMVTTRAEVESKFGVAKLRYADLVYSRPGYQLIVFYASGRCTKLGSLGGGYNVPKDTVLQFRVEFSPEIRLEDLKIDRSKFKRYKDREALAFAYYQSPLLDITITTHRNAFAPEEEWVKSIEYIGPTPLPEQFVCPGSEEIEKARKAAAECPEVPVGVFREITQAMNAATPSSWEKKAQLFDEVDPGYRFYLGEPVEILPELVCPMMIHTQGKLVTPSGAAFEFVWAVYDHNNDSLSFRTVKKNGLEYEGEMTFAAALAHNASLVRGKVKMKARSNTFGEVSLEFPFSAWVSP